MMLQAYNIHISNPKIEYEHRFTEIDFICYIIQRSSIVRHHVGDVLAYARVSANPHLVQLY